MSVIDHSAFAQAAGLPPRQACGACREGQKLPFDFTMAFQPIVDLRSGGAWGYEALVRGTAGEPAGWILERVDGASIYAFDQACRVKAIDLVGVQLPNDGAPE